MVFHDSFPKMALAPKLGRTLHRLHLMNPYPRVLSQRVSFARSISTLRSFPASPPSIRPRFSAMEHLGHSPPEESEAGLILHT